MRIAGNLRVVGEWESIVVLIDKFSGNNERRFVKESFNVVKNSWLKDAWNCKETQNSKRSYTHTAW